MSPVGTTQVEAFERLIAVDNQIERIKVASAAPIQAMEFHLTDNQLAELSDAGSYTATNTRGDRLDLFVAEMDLADNRLELSSDAVELKSLAGDDVVQPPASALVTARSFKMKMDQMDQLLQIEAALGKVDEVCRGLRVPGPIANHAMDVFADADGSGVFLRQADKASVVAAAVYTACYEKSWPSYNATTPFDALARACDVTEHQVELAFAELSSVRPHMITNVTTVQFAQEVDKVLELGPKQRASAVCVAMAITALDFVPLFKPARTKTAKKSKNKSKAKTKKKPSIRCCVDFPSTDGSTGRHRACDESQLERTELVRQSSG